MHVFLLEYTGGPETYIFSLDTVTINISTLKRKLKPRYLSKISNREAFSKHKVLEIFFADFSLEQMTAN